MSFKTEITKPWEPDTRQKKVIEKLANKYRLSYKDVYDIIKYYYRTVAIAMDSNRLLRIRLYGIGLWDPMPNFIRKHIGKLKKLISPEHLERAKIYEDNVDKLQERKDRHRKKYKFLYGAKSKNIRRSEEDDKGTSDAVQEMAEEGDS